MFGSEAMVRACFVRFLTTDSISSLVSSQVSILVGFVFLNEWSLSISDKSSILSVYNCS